MKKVFFSLVFVVFFLFPMKAHAAGAAAGAIGAFMVQEQLDHLAVALNWVTQAADAAMQIKHLYDQLEHMKASTERAINNLQGVLDVRSFSDFMGWFDRQLYLEREVERRYGNMGVTIGRKSYHVSEIDRIPDALKSEYVDRWGKELSEEERKKLWADLGLSPGNYMYLQTWKERGKKISQRVRTMNDIFYEELDDAASRNNALLAKFAEENDKLDINEISKDQAAILAQIEMAVREGNIATNNLAEQIQTLDEKNNGAFLYSPYPLAGSNFHFADIPIPGMEIDSYGTPFSGRY